MRSASAEQRSNIDDLHFSILSERSTDIAVQEYGRTKNKDPPMLQQIPIIIQEPQRNEIQELKNVPTSPEQYGVRPHRCQGIR